MAGSVMRAELLRQVYHADIRLNELLLSRNCPNPLDTGEAWIGSETQLGLLHLCQKTIIFDNST